MAMENKTSPQQKPVITLDIPHPSRSSRGLALAFLFFFFPKVVMLIPHLVILSALGMVVFVLTIVAQIIVLITGHYPEGIHEIVVGILRWQIRVNAYFIGLTDTYPPFSMK